MTESQIQQGCVNWYRYQYSQWGRFLIAIPNGSYLNGTPKQRAMQWSKLEREGAVAGASDLILFDPKGNKLPLLLECKKPKGSQSKPQVFFQCDYEQAGYTYFIFTSLDQFMCVVNPYLLT